MMQSARSYELAKLHTYVYASFFAQLITYQRTHESTAGRPFTRVAFRGGGIS